MRECLLIECVRGRCFTESFCGLQDVFTEKFSTVRKSHHCADWVNDHVYQTKLKEWNVGFLKSQ